MLVESRMVVGPEMVGPGIVVGPGVVGPGVIGGANSIIQRVWMQVCI